MRDWSESVAVLALFVKDIYTYRGKCLIAVKVKLVRKTDYYEE